MTKNKYLIKSRDGSVYDVEGVDAKDVICKYAAYCGIQSISIDIFAKCAGNLSINELVTLLNAVLICDSNDGIVQIYTGYTELIEEVNK